MIVASTSGRKISVIPLEEQNPAYGKLPIHKRGCPIVLIDLGQPFFRIKCLRDGEWAPAAALPHKVTSTFEAKSDYFAGTPYSTCIFYFKVRTSRSKAVKVFGENSLREHKLKLFHPFPIPFASILTRYFYDSYLSRRRRSWSSPQSAQ
jgi:hypothetical protein